MNSVGNDFLASAAVADDQHGGTDAGYFVNDVIHTFHRLAVTEQPFDAIAAQYSLCSGEFAAHIGAAARTIDCKPQLLHIQRLLKKINGAILKQLERGRRMLSPSKANDRRSEWKVGRSSKEKVRSLLFPRFMIQQNDVSLAGVDFLNGGLG